MAKKRKKKHQEEEGGEAWLLPYSDLMTLLLAVFIVLFAVSKMDQGKSEEMAAAFRQNIVGEGGGIFSNDGNSIINLYPGAPITEPSTGSEGNAEGGNGEGTGTGASREKIYELLGQKEVDSLESLQQSLEVLFEQEDVDTSIYSHIDERGLVISLDNTILFESGSAQLKPENEDTLLKIAETINTMDNYIRIEGHTDNRPIHTAVYPSNWELSAARAASVVKLFRDSAGIAPEKMVAVGYAEFKPVADNSTEEGRAENRRIDIIILSERYNSLEEQIDDITAIED